MFWILDKDKNPVKVSDPLVWAEFFASPIENRRVAHTNILGGEIYVSTVFVGWQSPHYKHRDNQSWPMLFETLVFGGQLDGALERSPTWDDAERLHNFMVERVKRTISPPPGYRDRLSVVRPI